MAKVVSYAHQEHLNRLLEIARESIKKNVKKPLPLNTIKVGQIVFLREKISEGANDYSPAGVYGYRGDAVVVRFICAYEDRDIARNPDYCTVKYRYAVAHCDYKGNECFTVDREEISPYDPLVTFNDQREYLSKHRRYKTLKERFGEMDYINCIIPE